MSRRPIGRAGKCRARGNAWVARVGFLLLLLFVLLLPAQAYASGVGSSGASVTGVVKQTTAPVAPVVSVIKQVTAPVVPVVKQATAPVVKQVTAPVAPVVSAVKQVTAPVVPVVKQATAPVVKQVAAPVVPVVKQVTAPVAPVVKQVATAVAPVVKQVTAPVAPVVKPATATVAPVSAVVPVLTRAGVPVAPAAAVLPPAAGRVSQRLVPRANRGEADRPAAVTSLLAIGTRGVFAAAPKFATASQTTGPVVAPWRARAGGARRLSRPAGPAPVPEPPTVPVSAGASAAGAGGSGVFFAAGVLVAMLLAGFPALVGRRRLFSELGRPAPFSLLLADPG
jgi:hypothetical protein